MATFIFANNIDTTLAGGISSASTSLTLSSTQNLPASVPSGSYLVMTLNDQATRTNYEIVYVTAITGATLTVLRGQEGTAAKAWLTGDYAFSGPTAGQMASFMQGASTGVTPGTYGDSTTVPRITVNAQGLVSGVTSVPIAFPITSFNGRAGAIVLNSGDVTTALGYNPVNKAGDTMTGALTFNSGVKFGSITVSSFSDLSKHIDLYGGIVGMSVTAGYLNYVVNSTSNHRFYSGTTLIATFSQTGQTILAGGLDVAGASTFRGTPVINSASAEADLFLQFNNSPSRRVYLSNTSSGSRFGINYTDTSGNYLGTGLAMDNTTGAVTIGTLTVSGAFQCATMNATASDENIKKNFVIFEPRPLHRSLPFWSYDRRDIDMKGLGPTAQAVEDFDPRYVGPTLPIEVGGETIEAKTIDKPGLAYEQAMWAGFEVDRLRARVMELELAMFGGG